jgi:signal transduction histidine kinase
VRDNGIGIDPENLKTIFMPYARTRAGREHTASGHGIGLSVVREIVVEHSGAVDAFSAGHGRGAEFLVKLPLAFIGAAPSLRCA